MLFLSFQPEMTSLLIVSKPDNWPGCRACMASMAGHSKQFSCLSKYTLIQRGRL